MTRRLPNPPLPSRQRRVTLVLVLALVVGLFGFAGTSSTTPAQAAVSVTQVGRWTFDAGTGTTAVDAVGSHPLTLASAAGWTAGIRGASALSTTGTSTSNAVSSGSVLTTSSSFSVSAYVKFASTTSSDYQTIVSQDGTNVSGFYLGLKPGGKLGFTKLASDANNAAVSEVQSTNAVVAGQWYHVAGVYSSTANTLALYVNGRLQSSGTAPAGWNATGAFAVGRGRFSAGPVDFVNGTIDDVRAYSGALTAGDVEQIADSAYYRFEEGSGTTAADEGLLVSTGTLVNGPTWTTGVIGSTAVGLDGADDYVTSASSVLDTSKSFSVSAWARQDGASTVAGSVISEDSTSASGFSLQSRTDGTWAFVRASADTTGATSTAAVSTAALTRGSWTHLVGVYDSVAKTLVLYVNGVKQSTTSYTTGWKATGNLVVGRDQSAGSSADFFNGAVDEVHAYPFVVDDATATQLATPPAPPRPAAPTATVTGPTSISLSWVAPAPIVGSAVTGYVVTPYLNGTAQTAQTFSSTATTQAFTGLTTGGSYRFTVSAVNANGTSLASAQSVAAVPAAVVPNAPTGVSATAGSLSATVTWTAPSSNGGSAVTGYRIVPYAAGVAQTAQDFASTATTQTATGLTSGTSYTFTVSALNAVGYGPASSASTAVTPSAGRPAAPATPTATAGVTSATVTWTAPASNGSAITGYVVTPYLAGTAQTAQTYASTATTQTLTGLTAGGSYTFTVAAVNAVGTSAASSASTAVVPYAVAAAPAITAATAGTQQVTLTWSAPSSNNGSAVTGYRVTPFIGDTAQTVQTFSSTATTQTLTGLTAGTAYTFTVAAVNAAGTGPASAASTSVTPNAAPTLTFAAPPAGQVGVAYSQQLTVNGGTAPYTWTVSTGSLPAGVALSTAGLLSGTPTTVGSTTFTVRVTDASGKTATRAVTLVITDKPSAPTTPTAKAGLGSAALTWSAPADNGSTITRYVITPYRDGVAQTAISVDPAAKTRTLSGLTAGSRYTFTVAAVNANGTSAASAASDAVTPYAALSAPTITAVTTGSTAATLSWTAPTDTGGSPVTGYVVTPYANGVAQTAQVFTSAATTQTVTGLTAGTAYTFRVAATNASGTSVLYRVNAAGPALAAVDGGPAWSADNTDPSAFRNSGSGTATYTSGGAVADGTVPSTTPNAVFDTERYGDMSWAFPVDTGVGVMVRLYFVNRYDGTSAVGARTYDMTLDGTVVLAGFDPVNAAGGTNRGTMREFALTSDGTVNIDTVRKIENPLLNGIEIVRTGVATTGPPSASSASVTPNAAPSLTFAAPPSGEVGVAYSQALTVNDGTGPYAWSVSTGSLPVGLSLSASTGLLSGTPTTAGSSTFTVLVTDASGLTASRQVTLVVAARPVVAFVPATGEVGVAYSQQPVVTGGTGPFTWAVTAGALPAGLSINPASGLVGGTPTAAGTSSVTVTVTDAYSQTAGRTVSILVAAQPAFTFTGPAAAQAGVAYSASLSASGGTAPLTWSVPTGSLPNGLTLDTSTGLLTGTPVTAGTSSFTAAVTDAFGQTVTRAVTLVVTTGPVVIAKTTSGASTVAGGTVTATITVTNTGTSTFSGITVSDPLAGVLDDAAYNDDARANVGTVSYTPGAVGWTGDLAAGAVATITYTVTVGRPVPVNGDQVLTDTVTSPTTGTNCGAGSTDARCTSTVTVSGLSIVKTAGNATTTPGSTVRFTVVVTNTGKTAYTGASLTDSLADVLDDATYDGNATATAGTLSYASPALTWSGNLAVGAPSVTITYTVTVANPDPGNRSLTGTVVSATSGSVCPSGNAAAFCSATVAVLVPALTITDAANVSSTTPGAVVRHTVTIANTGQTPYTAAAVTVALAGALDDAIYGADATTSTGTLGYAGGTLTWTGDLAVGATAVVTFSVTVNNPDVGDRTLATVVTSAAAGSTCPSGSTSSACTSRVSVLVPALSLTTTSNVSSTTPGSVVRYTVLVADTGQTAYTGATFTESLTGILDDATLTGDTAATTGTASVNGSTLTWTGDLAVGASATITYSVTVRQPDPGDRTLASTLVSTTPFNNCAGASTDTRCTSSVRVLVPALSLGLSTDVASVIPSGTVRPTLTVQNTGQTAYSGAVVVLGLTGALDDATSGSDFAVSTGTLAADAAGNLVWTLNLAVGASASATGSLVVRNPDPGDRSVVTTIGSDVAGSTCPVSPTSASCTSTVPVLTPGLTITKTASRSTVQPGQQVGYTITVSNTGQSVQTAASLTDSLAQVLTDATYDGNAVATTGTVSYAAGSIGWTGGLALGATATITYSVTVRDPDPGDKQLTNTVVSATAGSNCRSGSTDTRCAATVNVLVPQLTIVKTAAQATTVRDAKVTYTVAVTNTGAVAYTGASFVDALAGVLDDAVYNGDAAASSGSVSVSSGAATWTGNLAVGASATITYSVQVNHADVGDDLLTSVTTSPTPGSNCGVGSTDPRCRTSVGVARLIIQRNAQETSTTPGSTVHIPATYTNTGTVPYVGITVVHPRADSADDVFPNGADTATSGTLVRTDDAINWTGDIPVGASVTVSIERVVRDPDPGNHVIAAVITSDAPGNNCLPGSTDPRCAMRIPVLEPRLTITKTASTTAVTPGGTVGYTITVANNGETPYTGTAVSDDLTGELDDATYNGDATATAGSLAYVSPVLTWTGDLAVGVSITITYSVTAKDPPTGDKVMTGPVSSGAVRSSCPPASSNVGCRTTVAVLTPALTLTKTANVAFATYGSTVAYTVTVTNTGQTSYAPAHVNDPLADVLADATWVGDQTASSGTLSFSSPVLSWSGALAPRASATITYSVVVKNPATGTRLSNVLVSDDAGSTCPTGGTDTRCRATVPIVSSVSLTFSHQISTPSTPPGGSVAFTKPGETVAYTLTATNASAQDITGAQFSDDLADVLDDATYNRDRRSDSGTTSFAGTTLSWSGTVPAASTVTITFSVTTSVQITGNQILTDRLASGSPSSSNNCLSSSTDVRCRSTVPVARLQLQQVFTESSTTPGSAAHIYATFTNTGRYAYPSVTVTNPATDIFDDAVPTGDQTASSGTLVVGPEVAVWTGGIPVGQTVVIRATVIVKDRAGLGNRAITSTLATDAPGSNCPSGGSDPQCTASVRVLLPALTVTAAASTTSTVPGATVGHTITIQNTGEAAYTGATVTTNLAGFLDDATYDAGATTTTGALVYSAPVITWTGDLGVGSEATIRFTTTVLKPDPGDKVMSYPVASDAAGSSCPAGSSNTACRVTVAVLTPELSFRSSTSQASAAPGETVTYTVVVTDTGQTPYPVASFDVALDGLLDDATVGGVSATTGSAAVTGSTLSWTGGLTVAGSATISFAAAVKPVPGDHELVQRLVSSNQGSTCTAGSTNAGCSTSVPISGLRISNVADVATVSPTGVIRFTGTVTNVGKVDYSTVSFTDSFVGALDDATYNGDATASSGSVQTIPGTGRLVWTGDLPVGGTITVTGSVTVSNPDPGDKVVTTRVSTAAAGSNCPVGSTDPACVATVTVLTPALAISTSVGAPTVSPGGTVGYTLTLVNSGQTDYVGATVVQSLGAVLDDARYAGGAVASRGTVAVVSGALRWTGDVPQGQTVVVTFSVQVNDPDLGDKVLVSTVSSDALGSSCTGLVTAGACTTRVTVLVPRVDTAITADRTTTVPGQTTTYTVSIANTGETAETAASVVVQLVGVLDDAAYDGDVAASRGAVSVGATDLTWTGDLAVGQTATVTFSVTVARPPRGDRVLVATLDSQTAGTGCRSGTGSATCRSSVAVLLPGLVVSTSADSATTTPGSTVRFVVTLTNTGQTAYPDASSTTALADLLDDATLVGGVTASTGTANLVGQTLSWNGALPLGVTAVVSFTALVSPTDQRGHRLVASTASDADGSTCPSSGSAPGCSATVDVRVPGLTILAAADVASTTPGGVVTYTTVITNTGETTQTDVGVSTSLAGVLTVGAYDADASVVGGGVLSYTAPALTWTGTLAAGASATVTFSVTANNPASGDRQLDTEVVSAAAGSSCPVGGLAATCSTHVPVLVPALQITKTADLTSVVAGSKVTYTVAVVNTGQTRYAAASWSDDLGGVLDDATYGADATATTGTVSFTDGTLGWTGALDVGASATIAYSVTTRFPATGNRLMNDTVVSPTTGVNCVPGTTRNRCRTTVSVLVPELSITKLAGATSVVAGATVRYVLTATNTGEASYAAATMTDSLAGVLDDGSYDADATATTGTVGFSGGVLTWNGPLARGATVVVTYSVTVRPNGTGDGRLINAVASSTVGSTCPGTGAPAACTAVTAVEQSVLSLSGLTSSFRLVGLPEDTVERDGAVTMTVLTNSFAGYALRVQPTTAVLTSPGSSDVIPIDRLRVRTGAGKPFRSLVGGQSLPVQTQDRASAPGGDAVSNDYQVQIPLVDSGDYGTTLEYVVTAQ